MRVTQLKTVLEAKACAATQGLALVDVLHTLAGKWTIVLLCTLGHQPLRFSQLQRLLPHLTPRTLSKELQELALLGLVDRLTTVAAPGVVSYRLTTSALDLVVVLKQLVAWGAQYRAQSLDSPL